MQSRRVSLGFRVVDQNTGKPVSETFKRREPAREIARKIGDGVGIEQVYEYRDAGDYASLASKADGRPLLERILAGERVSVRPLDPRAVQSFDVKWKYGGNGLYYLYVYKPGHAKAARTVMMPRADLENYVSKWTEGSETPMSEVDLRALRRADYASRHGRY